MKLKRLGRLLGITIPVLIITSWALDWFIGRPFRGIVDMVPLVIGSIIGGALVVYSSKDVGD